MYMVVFDTETSGFGSKVGNEFKPPHLVQLAWQRIAFSARGNCHVLEKRNLIIQPQKDATWSMHAQAVHGISEDVARRTGVNAKRALKEFQRSVLGAHVAVAHNSSFDIRIIDSVFEKVTDRKFKWRNTRCTGRGTVDLTRIPCKNNKSFKMPKLAELYSHLHQGAGTFNFHNAEDDVQCLVECVKKLYALKHDFGEGNPEKSVYFI